MAIETEWHHVTRIAWITGGVVAVSPPGPVVHIFAGLGGPPLGALRIPAYPSLFAVLRQQGFLILGAVFVIDSEEALGLRPPQFRAICCGDGSWLASDVHQKWRQIAHASGKCDNMPLMDIAARIASGLQYSEMRLYDLAAAYGVQLRSRLHGKAPEKYQRFKDLNSSAVYKAIHALFWEMAVLRDVLAEFAAAYCFHREGITSFAGLVKSLRKNPSEDPIASQVLASADEAAGGWLAIFTAYRNLFTHSAPMEQVAGLSFAVQDMRVISAELSIPQIYYPLPADVAELARRRSGGTLFSTLKEMNNAHSQRQHERVSEPDALEYLAMCLEQLVQMSLALVARSPVAPQPIEIGPKDIIGGVQISPRM